MMIDSDARKVHSMKNPSNIRSLHYHKIVEKQENSKRTRSMWVHDKNVLYKQRLYFAYFNKTYYENASNGEQPIP